MFKECLENVKSSTPLIHCITNYVTVNDVANVLLACGGSPIMADEPDEAEDITAICNGLDINIGTLNKRTINSMLIAGKKANEMSKVVLLDPVGAGASKLRTETAVKLMDEIKFDVIRGNVSEFKALALGCTSTRGVDAGSADKVSNNNLDEMVKYAKDFARSTHSIIAITGAIDLVADENTCYCIRNGRPEMCKITGTGCQLSGIIAAYVAANKENKLEAAAAAVCLMGYAGELAFERLTPEEGNIAYRGKIIDAIYNMTGEMLERGAKYEIR